MALFTLHKMFITEFFVSFIMLIVSIVLIAKHETIKRERIIAGIILLFGSVVILLISVLYIYIVTTIPESIQVYYEGE